MPRQSCAAQGCGLLVLAFLGVLVIGVLAPRPPVAAPQPKIVEPQGRQADPPSDDWSAPAKAPEPKPVVAAPAVSPKPQAKTEPSKPEEPVEPEVAGYRFHLVKGKTFLAETFDQDETTRYFSLRSHRGVGLRAAEDDVEEIEEVGPDEVAKELGKSRSLIVGSPRPKRDIVFGKPTGVTASPPASGGPPGYASGGGRAIHTGPRGGQFYTNGHGNKTYIRRR